MQAGAEVDFVMPQGRFRGAVMVQGDSDLSAGSGRFYSAKNTEIGNGATALHAAVENGHYDTVRVLLRRGASQLATVDNIVLL